MSTSRLHEDNRHIKQEDRKIVILAPTKTRLRSYHSSGLSSKDEYMNTWRKAQAIKNEFRL